MLIRNLCPISSVICNLPLSEYMYGIARRAERKR